ncbi:MAG: hypothetical protein ACLFUE_09620 [Desulfobacteraceae bacterium]
MKLGGRKTRSGLFVTPSIFGAVGRITARAATAVSLILVYYLVITPWALIRRVLRRDESILPGIDLRASTYWVARRGSKQPRERPYKRF